MKLRKSTSRKAGRFHSKPRVLLIAALAPNSISGCQATTHQVLPNSPKCGCWATSIVGCCQGGGIGCCTGRVFASLRLGGLAASFLASTGGICSDSGNWAKASRTRAFGEATVTAGDAAATAGAAIGSLAFATVTGAIVGWVVSNTTRSGHFRSE